MAISATAARLACLPATGRRGVRSERSLKRSRLSHWPLSLFSHDPMAAHTLIPTGTYGAHIYTNLTFRHSHWIPHLQPYFLGQGLRQRAAPPTCQPRPPVPAFVRWLWCCPLAALACSSASARQALLRRILLAHRERDSMASATNHSTPCSFSLLCGCMQPERADRQFPSRPFYSCYPAPACGGVSSRPHAPPQRLPLIVCLLPSCPKSMSRTLLSIQSISVRGTCFH